MGKFAKMEAERSKSGIVILINFEAKNGWMTHRRGKK